jgi:hypothetical protein
MPAQKSQGKKGCAKLGRNSKKCQQYQAMHTREKNKIKRVLQSNGETYAQEWAKTHNVIGVLQVLINGRNQRTAS